MRVFAAVLASSETSLVRSVNDCPTMSGRAPTRYHPAGRSAAASAARSCRRTLLRTTDGPTARPMANATLGGEASGSIRQLHHSAPARIRRPSRETRAMVLRSRIRQIKPTDGGDPWRGVPSERRGHHGCSYGCESRAYGPCADCSVGRCASRHPPQTATARAVG